MGVTKSNIESFRREVEQALATIGQKYGTKLAMGRIGYNSESLSCRLTGVNIGGSYAAATVQVPLNLRELIGRRFKVRKTVYTVLSINDKPKFNVVARTHRGVTYDTTLDFIQSGVEIK